MNLEPMQKAAVLIEALPYIQRFNRKIVVVKYGGSAMVRTPSGAGLSHSQSCLQCPKARPSQTGTDTPGLW